MSDFDEPHEGTPAPADVSGSDTTLPTPSVTDNVTQRSDANAPQNLLDQNLDETNVEDVLRSRVTISTLASMASLDVVIPGGGALRGLYDTQFRTKEMNDDFSISNLGGSLEQYFQFLNGEVDGNGRKIEKDDDDDDNTIVGAFRQVRENEEREERERQQWAKDEHSFAGVEMTGEEWGQLANDIGPNGKMRQWLVQRLIKSGKTQAQAEQQADEMQEIYRIQAMPETQRSPGEKTKLQNAEQNPEFRATTAALKAERESSFGAANNVEKTTTRANQAISVESGANAFDGDEPIRNTVKPEIVAASSRSKGAEDFPSAPDLKEHHQAALAATMPLDAPKLPVQVAAIAPAPTPGGGFDV